VLRLDHQLLNSTRIAFNLSKEWINTVFAPIAYPTEPPSISTPNSQAIYSLTVTTVIRANLINEVLVGVNRPRQPEDPPIGAHLCTFCNAGINPKAQTGGGLYQLRFTSNTLDAFERGGWAVRWQRSNVSVWR